MTREEARQIIAIWLVSSKGSKGQIGYIEGWFDEEDAEAFRMAIEALQAKTDGDLISRQDAIDAFNGVKVDEENCTEYDIGYNDGIDYAISKLSILPSAEPKTETVLCALADRTCPFQGKEYAWCLTCPHYTGSPENPVYVVPSGLSNISDEDRDLVKKAVSKPKTGEWIEVEVLPEVYDIEGVKTWGSKMQCDQCGFGFTAIEGHIRQYNYCPYCGSFNGVRKNDKR